jgi:hypothetical protein
MQITTIGLDIAKNVFQVHGIDAAERSSFASNSGAARCWHSSKHCRRVLSAWRPARRPRFLLHRGRRPYVAHDVGA